MNEPLNAQSLLAFAGESLNPHRALVQATRIAASLEKTDRRLMLSRANLQTLLRVCGSSDSFAEMIAANPALIGSLGASATTALRRDYRGDRRRTQLSR
jgi:glutamine synthetase adenylyltransferase